MMPWQSFRARRRAVRAAILLLIAVAGIFLCTDPAAALITGGEGNAAIDDPGWPHGAAALFNHPGRVAWWEGPPFGGGQWHAECRGDAKALNAVLKDFAKLPVKKKRVVVHDGVGRSFWLNPNGEPAKEPAAAVDWVLVVWRPASFEKLRQLPSDLNPTDVADTEALIQIDVYTGGAIRWSEVAIPKGLEVIDQRLATHGFTPADGVVLEGTVFDVGTQTPVLAHMTLQNIEPRTTGGYKHTVVAEASADKHGRWVLKNTPAGWHRVVVEAKGYVPRVVGYIRHDGQPRWQSYRSGLARNAEVAGHVSDQDGKPLPDVEVRLADVSVAAQGRYEAPHEYKVKTDAKGNFRFNSVPVGNAMIRLHKAGYCRPGLGHPITTPAKDIVLGMMKSAAIQVTVDFAGMARPSSYIVAMEPDGGAAVGKWSGSGNIDAMNQITFKDVPPGYYEIHGHPNPSSADERTTPLLVELKGGETKILTIRAH